MYKIKIIMPLMVITLKFYYSRNIRIRSNLFIYTCRYNITNNGRIKNFEFCYLINKNTFHSYTKQVIFYNYIIKAYLLVNNPIQLDFNSTLVEPKFNSVYYILMFQFC